MTDQQTPGNLALAAGEAGPRTEAAKIREAYNKNTAQNAKLNERSAVLHPVIGASRIEPYVVYDEEDGWIVCTTRMGRQVNPQTGQPIVGPLACNGIGAVRLSEITTIVPQVSEYDDLDAQQAAAINVDPDANELQLEKAKLEAAQTKVFYSEGVGIINRRGQITYTTLTLDEVLGFMTRARSMTRESLAVIRATQAMDEPTDDDVQGGSFGNVD